MKFDALIAVATFLLILVCTLVLTETIPAAYLAGSYAMGAVLVGVTAVIEIEDPNNEISFISWFLGLLVVCTLWPVAGARVITRFIR